MIKDTYNRKHSYLRISLTDNCNLNCFYCMPEEDYDFTPASKIMQAPEIVELAKVFVANGVNEIRLTGGEPLVRRCSRYYFDFIPTACDNLVKLCWWF